MSTTIQELSDRQAIVDLIDGLGAWLDDQRFDEARSVLAEQVEVRTPGGTSSGVEAVAAQARRNHEGYRTQHVITNTLVDLDGDEAEARANLVATFVRLGDEAAAPVTLGERYRFRAVRTSEGWRLVRIEVIPVWRDGELPRPTRG